MIVGFIIKWTLGFKDFLDAFIYFLILGETLNVFDLVVIDLLWWKNTRRIRFSSIQNKELYQNPKTHLDSFYRAILMYIVVAILLH